MGTLAFIATRYGLDLNQPSPIHLQEGRFRGLPALFKALGYKIGAEVGILEGSYARYLLRGIPGLKLYGIDAWAIYPDFDSAYSIQHQERLAQAYDRCIANTRGYDCELIRGMSDEVANRFSDESLDFVFIDANHRYEYVVRDIALWSKKVRKGGVVYGHDFDDFSATPQWAEYGVIPAVEGWMRAYKIAPWFVTTNNKNHCWMYIK